MQEIGQRRMRYFREVLSQGSIRKAADNLNTAASVIARQIKLLEEEIGEMLFERQPRGMVATEAAMHLLAYLHSCEAQQKQLEERLQALHGLQAGSVRILVAAGYVDALMTQVLLEFRARHPGLRIAVETASAHEVLAELARNRAHIGIAFNPPAHPDIEWRASVPRRIGAVVRRDHPLAQCAGSSISPRELFAHALGVMPSSFGVGQMVREMALEENVELRPRLLTNSIPVMRHFVASGLGVALGADDRSERQGIPEAAVFIPIRHAAAESAHVVLLVKARRPLGAAADELLRWILERMSPFSQARPRKPGTAGESAR